MEVWRWGPLPRACVASTRLRCEADPGSVRQAIYKSNKNDFLDAEAVAEAMDRQNMRPVLIKMDDHLALQALNRVRDRLIARRTRWNLAEGEQKLRQIRVACDGVRCCCVRAVFCQRLP
jgi:hypothetical protein